MKVIHQDDCQHQWAAEIMRLNPQIYHVGSGSRWAFCIVEIQGRSYNFDIFLRCGRFNPMDEPAEIGRSA